MHRHRLDHPFKAKINFHRAAQNRIWRLGFNRLVSALVLILTLQLPGCQSQSGKRPSSPSDCCHNPQSHQEFTKRKVLGIVDGELIYEDQMLKSLLEASGAEIFLEHVLQKLIHRAYQQGVTDGQFKDVRPDIDAAKAREATIFRRNMAADPVMASRLEKRVKLERGLGFHRYDLLLARNALLREMIKDRVKITEDMLKQTFQRIYGEKFVLQIITAPDLKAANSLLAKIQAATATDTAETFSRLARKHSTDDSARNSGFLPPVSPADDQWPMEIRRMAGRLKIGEVSSPVVLPGPGGKGTQVGILRLDERLEAQKTVFSDVKAKLKVQLQDRLESVQMQQLSRRLLVESDISIMHRDVKKAFEVITGQTLTPTN